MAFLLGCEKVRVDFPTKVVFESLSLGVDEGARIGIVGKNGGGKSSLLSLLSGNLEPDAGRVVRTRGVSVGLLKQSDSLNSEHTVHQAVVGDMPEYEWAANAEIRDILQGLGLVALWERKVKNLSGGQRRRVDLARLLVGAWDVLMLDEPTNHLDLPAITWLANHLKHRWREGSGCLLVVTHDRWFLDEVCTSMWEVHDRKVEPFEGGFSAYILQRIERDRLADLAEQKRQNELRRELAWLSRGARARATKPKFHVAKAQALIADVPELRNSLELKRMAVARLGKQVISLENVSFAFDSKQPVLSNITLNIGAGDRFGIVGANGAGKTTLLKLIQGALIPTSGTVKIGQTVRFAVLSQHLDELNACGNDRVRQVIGRYSRRRMADGKEMTPAQLLERLGFSNADLNEPVKDLSGGQKRRLALMLILLDEPNVLILDEPGNDLDTDMLAAVETLLDGWSGTLLLVTHDRYLMERVTDDQFALVGTALRHLPGGIDEYLRMLSQDEGAFQQELRAAGKGQVSQEPPKEAPAKRALTGGEIRTLRKTLESSERKMQTLQGKIDAVHERMQQAAPSDFVALTDLQKELDELHAQKEELELVWLDAAEALGE